MTSQTLHSLVLDVLNWSGLVRCVYTFLHLLSIQQHMCNWSVCRYRFDDRGFDDRSMEASYTQIQVHSCACPASIIHYCCQIVKDTACCNLIFCRLTVRQFSLHVFSQKLLKAVLPRRERLSSMHQPTPDSMMTLVITTAFCGSMLGSLKPEVAGQGSLGPCL